MYKPRGLRRMIFVAAISPIVWGHCRAVAQPVENQAGSVVFTASPMVGPAPLTVQFNARGTRTRGVDIGASVDFGDGEMGKLLSVPVCLICDPQANTSHVYRSAGRFTATLLNSANVAIATVTGFVEAQ